MKKSQLPLKFLVRLLLGIIIAVPIIMFGSNLFRLSAQGTEYYGALYDMINEISGKGPGEGDTLPLRLDQNTAIFGFSDEGDFSLLAGPQDTEIISVKRPFKCEGSSCLCLCKELDISEMELIEEIPQSHLSDVPEARFEVKSYGEVSSAGFIHEILACKDGKLVCKSFEEAAKITDKFGFRFNNKVVASFNNGFILGRYKQKIPRIRDVAVQKLESGKIAVCNKLPCE